jgi:hypothetical protein
MLSQEDEVKLDTLIDNLTSFIQSNDGQDKTEVEKDGLYISAQTLWKQLRDELVNMHFKFYLKRDQYDWLTNMLLSELEYDANTIFIAVELTEMLGKWKFTGPAKNDKSVVGYVVNPTELQYIYQLIAQHKVKGLTQKAYRFAEVIRNIFRVLQIVSYYDNHVKDLNKKVVDWAASFTPPTQTEEV